MKKEAKKFFRKEYISFVILLLIILFFIKLLYLSYDYQKDHLIKKNPKTIFSTSEEIQIYPENNNFSNKNKNANAYKFINQKEWQPKNVVKTIENSTKNIALKKELKKKTKRKKKSKLEYKNHKIRIVQNENKKINKSNNIKNIVQLAHLIHLMLQKMNGNELVK